jgi:hypothetical protein
VEVSLAAAGSCGATTALVAVAGAGRRVGTGQQAVGRLDVTRLGQEET